MSGLAVAERLALGSVIDARISLLRAELVAALGQSDRPAAIRVAKQFDEIGDATSVASELASKTAAIERDIGVLRGLLNGSARLDTAQAGDCSSGGEATSYARWSALAEAGRGVGCQSSYAHEPNTLRILTL